MDNSIGGGRDPNRQTAKKLTFSYDRILVFCIDKNAQVKSLQSFDDVINGLFTFETWLPCRNFKSNI